MYVVAHDKSVCGVVTDILNQLVVTTGTDKLTKFWNFKSRELMDVVNLEYIASRISLHRERFLKLIVFITCEVIRERKKEIWLVLSNSGLLAMSLEDFSLQLLDLDTKRIVRIFEGHAGRITTFVSENTFPYNLLKTCIQRRLYSSRISKSTQDG